MVEEKRLTERGREREERKRDKEKERGRDSWTEWEVVGDKVRETEAVKERERVSKGMEDGEEEGGGR